MTNTTETTDIDIRESAQRVVELLQHNRGREALELLERERSGERLVVQEALDRYVAADGAAALAMLRANPGVSAELAATVERLERAQGAPRYPAANPRGTNELAGLSEAQRHDVYASILSTQGSRAAHTALGNGDRVILGLRNENSTFAAASRIAPGERLADNPNTARDESRGGTGVYDDRMVVLWRDANGTGHVYEALYANTEPTAQYDHHAGSDGRRPYSDGGTDQQVRAASSGYEDILRPRKIEGDDVNNDGVHDLGRLATGTYEMRLTTHPWGGQDTFALRPTDAAVLDGQNRVERDTNADGHFTAADADRWQPLNRSFKIHFGSSGSTDSAGCQTIHPNYTDGFARAAQGNQQQTQWQYVLVPTTPALWRDVQAGATQAPAEGNQSQRAAPAQMPPVPVQQQTQDQETPRGQPPHESRHTQAVPSNHPDRNLLDAIQRQLPAGTPLEQAAHVMAQARENGIRDVHQLDRVTVVDNQAWVVGRTPGFLAKVDLGAPAPPLQESLRALESTAQETQRATQDSPRISGPTMG